MVELYKIKQILTTIKRSQYHRCRSPFLDLHLSIANGIVSSKINDDFDFDTVLFLHTFTDVVRRPELSIAGQLIISVSPRFLNGRYRDLFNCA